MFRMTRYTKLRYYVRWLALLFLLWPGQAAGQETLEAVFYSETGVSAEALSEGAVGVGIWVYYYQNRPKIAVRLSKDQPDAPAVADIYHTPPHVSQLPIRVEKNKVRFFYDAPATIKINALDGWWTRDDVTSFNLDLTVRGPIYALWGAESWISEVVENQEVAKIQVRDPLHTGLPDWELRQLTPPFHRMGILRTQYSERQCKTDTAHLASITPLWPYITHSGGYEQHNGRFSPPLKVNWEQGRIHTVGEFVTARNQNCSYTIYSLDRLELKTTNQANFESPFAFYDLSNEGQGYPNLILRTERFPARDKWSLGLDFKGQDGRLIPYDFQTIRYSWRNQIGDQKWDYKIEVMGTHPYKATTTIANSSFSIDAPNYSEFPLWVLERDWPVTTFVDTTRVNLSSNEGIYAWSPREIGVGTLYGWNKPNQYAFNYIPVGYRGEYRADVASKPRLYISPVDQQLHLLGAERGVWQVNSSRRIELTRLGDQPYLNQWETIIHNVQVNTLYALRDYLLYKDANGIRLKRATYQPAIAQFQPPHNNQTWLAGRAALDRTPRDPRQLSTWIDTFTGPELAFDNGEIETLRVTEDGFRMSVSLPPATVVTRNELTPLQHWGSGVYAIIYDGRLQVQQWSPPNLSIAGGINDRLTMAPRIYEANQLAINLRNDGFADAEDVTVTVDLGSTQIISKEHVTILGGESTTVQLPWTPYESGDVIFTINAFRSGFGFSATYTETVEIDTLPTATVQNPDHTFALLTMWPQSLLLILTGCITAGFIWQLTQPTLKQ